MNVIANQVKQSSFEDRAQAGKLLADALKKYAHQKELLVLALPRGGVPVAFEIAQKLNAPMDLCLVRKLGFPDYEELAMGAIAYDGAEFISVFNEDVNNEFQISSDVMEAVIEKEKTELLRRNIIYRQGRPFPEFKNSTIILADDGVATGATIRAAIAVIQKAKPKKLIIAVPVAEPFVYDELSELVDEVICLMQVQPLYGVGSWYQYFPQLTDAEVIDLCQKSQQI